MDGAFSENGVVEVTWKGLGNDSAMTCAEGWRELLAGRN